MTQPKYYFVGILSRIAEEIGPDVAIALAMARGGREIYVPKRPKPDDTLSQIVGLPAAKQLQHLIGEGRHRIPLGSFGGQGGRQQRILALWRNGKSQSEIAAEVDVSLRTVERILGKRPDPNQPELPLFSDPDN